MHRSERAAKRCPRASCCEGKLSRQGPRRASRSAHALSAHAHTADENGRCAILPRGMPFRTRGFLFSGSSPE